LFDIWLRQLDETPAKHVRSLGCPKRESIAFFFARLSSYTFYRNENAGIIVENSCLAVLDELFTKQLGFDNIGALFSAHSAAIVLPALDELQALTEPEQ
jgi:hypothetical protein